ncbi:MAG: chemotaxis protein CheW [Clostridiales bacterium]|nr:chemotaxis protein CheW [Clostridiales bacterium]
MTENQFVVFILGDEKYGVDILNVSTISEYMDITKVPDAPTYVEGIINLRGDIIPVINLKKRFNIAETSVSDDTRIIIYSIDGVAIGFLVDEASQVLRIDDKDIESTPAILTGKDREYISGVGKHEGKIIILLDFAKILNESERAVITKLV